MVKISRIFIIEIDGKIRLWGRIISLEGVLFEENRVSVWDRLPAKKPAMAAKAAGKKVCLRRQSCIGNLEHDSFIGCLAIDGRT